MPQVPSSRATLAERAHDTLVNLHYDAYALWKRGGRHVEEYGCEFVGTAIIVFAVVGFVTLMFSSLSPVHLLIPPKPLRLLCAGFLIGSTGSLFTISSLGRLSGAHINPALSLSFAIAGKMHWRDLAGYVFAQMTGGVVGAVLAKAALGAAAAHVHQAALAPGRGVSVPVCFFTELGATLVYIYGLLTCVSYQKSMRYTPLLNVALAASTVCADGSISGAGMNPARWFGPAVTTDTWALTWLYLGAPLIAGVLAALLRRLAPEGRQAPRTAKLFHDPHFRSIFMRDKARSTPPESVRPPV